MINEFLKGAMRYSVSAENPLPVSGKFSTGSLTSAQVTVGTTAVKLASVRAGRNAITVTNPGAVAVLLGPQGVTATTGHFLPGGTSLKLETTAALFAVTAMGTQPVSVLETFD